MHTLCKPYAVKHQANVGMAYHTHDHDDNNTNNNAGMHCCWCKKTQCRSILISRPTEMDTPDISLKAIVTLLHPRESKAHLLVATLHAAVPFKQVNGIAELVSKDLDFDVAGSLDEPLQQNALISKGRNGLPLG